MSLALTEDERLALLAEAVERARQDPVAWCELIGNGAWLPYRHSRVMLDTVRQECENGDGRVIVSVSVGTGKSDSVVKGFGSWWLGKHPTDRIIGGAAGQSLANHNSQGIRDRLTEWGGRVFDTRVDQTSRAKNQWGIAGTQGGYLAVGRGASPEGFRGHVLIDDPFGPLSTDTPVPTPTGWSTMGELRVGDEVFDHAGHPCRVVGLTERFRAPRHRVRFSDNSYIDSHPDHYWRAFNRKDHAVYTHSHVDYDEDWWSWHAQARGNRQSDAQVRRVTTTEISGSLRGEGSRSAMRNWTVPTALPLDLPAVNLPIDPYILGYWLGNGTRGFSSVTCHVDDVEPIVSEVHKAGYFTGAVRLNAGLGRQFTIKTSENTNRWTGSLRRDLRELGVDPRKHIPDLYLRASARQRLALLQGLMDSDGHVSPGQGACRFDSVDKELCDGVAELFTSLGAKAGRASSKATGFSTNPRDLGHPIYRVTSFPQFTPFRLPRKIAGFVPGGQIRRVNRTIVDVEVLEETEHLCITVDSPSHMFLAGRAMVPTCNSYADAMSPTSREVAREWWQNSLRPRMNPGCWAIVICSRWHVDDLSGWLMKEFGQQWREIRMPAICDSEDDPLGREIGESIWPEVWSLEALAKARQETVSEGGEITWSARYQQTPMSMAARMFPDDKWDPVTSTEGLNIVRRARGWDLAASEATGDWTVGVLMGKLDDGRFFIEDIVRVQAGPDGVRALMVDTATADRNRSGPLTTQVIPQDPGQAGKPISVEASVAMGDGSHRRLGDVTVGDSVIGKDGQSHRVSAVHEQGHLAGVSITTKSGRVVEAALDHPFLTTIGWKEAGLLTIGDHLAVPNGYETEPTDAPRPIEEARLIGYFLGDGCCSGGETPTSPSLSAEICVVDPQEEADILTCARAMGFGTRTSTDYIRVLLSGGVRPWLRETGLAGQNSFTKRVPGFVFSQGSEYVRNLVGAYFACDGSIAADGKCAELYSVHRDLLRDIQRLLTRLGIWSELRFKNGRYLESRHASWRLYIPVRKGNALRRFLLSIPVHNTDKQAQMINVGVPIEFDPPHLADRVTVVDRVDDIECRCLTVEDAESFLAEELVVHNSQVGQLARLLAPSPTHSQPISGSKDIRAAGYASLQRTKSILILDGPHTLAFRAVHSSFPGRTDDDVDAAADAFNFLAGEVSTVDAGAQSAYAGLGRATGGLG